MNPRINLAAALPLPAPFVLMIEPTNVCNFRCPICPESFEDYAEQAGYYQKMSPETWLNVTTGLTSWPKIKVIRFWHTGEPLLNRGLAQMISGAHALSERTEVTTNASTLDERWARDLISCQLDHLRVSVYSTTDAGYERSTGSRYRLQDIRKNIMNLRAERNRQGSKLPFIYAELVSQEAGQEAAFREQWQGIADKTGVKPLHNWGASFVTLGEHPRPPKLICPYPFYQLVIKANGDVSVCCVDWSNKLVVGNVNETALREIWEGSRLAELRAVHLSGRRDKLTACRDCNVLHTSPDNLDSLLPAAKV